MTLFQITATCAEQMEGRWESNMNVWFRFIYSQKWNCAVSQFPKQNYNALPPNFHIHVYGSDLYIPRISLPILLQPKLADRSWEHTNHTQIRECRNWERSRAVSFLGIQYINRIFVQCSTLLMTTTQDRLKIFWMFVQTCDIRKIRKLLYDRGVPL